MEKNIFNLDPSDKLSKKTIICDFMLNLVLFQISVGLNYGENHIKIISGFNPLRWSDTMQALKKRLKAANTRDKNTRIKWSRYLRVNVSVPSKREAVFRQKRRQIICASGFVPVTLAPNMIRR